jgi:hypothetical protein
MCQILQAISEETLLYLFVRAHGDLPPEVDGEYRFPADFVAAHRDTAARLVHARLAALDPPTDREVAEALDRLAA